MSMVLDSSTTLAWVYGDEMLPLASLDAELRGAAQAEGVVVLGS